MLPKLVDAHARPGNTNAAKGKDKNEGDVVTSVPDKRGNSETYLLRRLKRDAPEARPHEETKGGRGKKTSDNITGLSERGTSETYLLRRLAGDASQAGRRSRQTRQSERGGVGRTG